MVTMVQILLTLPDQKGKSSIMQFNRDNVTLAKKNEYFRQEVVTGAHSQVVLMSIPPGSVSCSIRQYRKEKNYATCT